MSLQLLISFKICPQVQMEGAIQLKLTTTLSSTTHHLSDNHNQKLIVEGWEETEKHVQTTSTQN